MWRAARPFRDALTGFLCSRETGVTEPSQSLPLLARCDRNGALSVTASPGQLSRRESQGEGVSHYRRIAAATPLPLPPGEVPQCAHWGGEGHPGEVSPFYRPGPQGLGHREPPTHAASPLGIPQRRPATHQATACPARDHAGAGGPAFPGPTAAAATATNRGPGKPDGRAPGPTPDESGPRGRAPLKPTRSDPGPTVRTFVLPFADCQG